jgi:hypothetical protein
MNKHDRRYQLCAMSKMIKGKISTIAIPNSFTGHEYVKTD